jgi:hypothetical protein
LLQDLAQEVEVRIGQLSAQSGLAAEAAGLQRPAHGIGVEKEFGGNGADLPNARHETDGGCEPLVHRGSCCTSGKGFTQRPRRPQI